MDVGCVDIDDNVNTTKLSYRSTIAQRNGRDNDGQQSAQRQQFQTAVEDNAVTSDASAISSSSSRNHARHPLSASLSVSTVPVRRAPTSSNGSASAQPSASSMAAALAVGSTPHGIDYILSKSSLSPTLSTSSSSSSSISCTSAEVMLLTADADASTAGVARASAVGGMEAAIGGPSLRSPDAPVSASGVIAPNLECGNGFIGHQQHQMQAADSLRAVVGPYGWAAVAAAAAAGMLPWKPHHSAGDL